MSKDQENNQQDRRKKDRRSTELAPDFVDRRKNRKDRREKDVPIDFPDRRKNQRRAPILGVDYQDRRQGDRREKQAQDDKDKTTRESKGGEISTVDNNETNK